MTSLLLNSTCEFSSECFDEIQGTVCYNGTCHCKLGFQVYTMDEDGSLCGPRLANDISGESDTQLDSTLKTILGTVGVTFFIICSILILINRRRKPFHYRLPHQTSYASNLGEAAHNGCATIDITAAGIDSDAVYRRYLFYSRLYHHNRPDHLRPEDNTMLIPDHVLPPHFFEPLVGFSSKKEEGATQSSIVTIFSIWNTMMGTSLLGMPWALSQAGLVGGILCILLVASIALYTAYRVMKLQQFSGFINLLGDGDVMEFEPLLKEIMGHRVWQWLSTIFSLMTLVGASVVYWVLLSNFLYNTVLMFFELAKGIHEPPPVLNFSYTDIKCPLLEPSNSSVPSPWNPPDGSNPLINENIDFYYFWNIEVTAPIALSLLLFPLVNMKSATFFTKFNSLGTAAVLFMVSFVIVKASQWGFHADFTHVASGSYVPLFKTSFPMFTGVLCLALFIHNCIISIMRSNRNQENNVRDLSTAFFLVAFTYGLVGVLFYLCWPIPKFCIEDNFLNNFVSEDWLSRIARMALLFQMVTVCPLLFYVIRIQVLFFIYGDVYPGFIKVVVLNVVMTTICILVAIFLPQIGTLIRFTGAFCGLAYVFTLPCLAHMKVQWMKGELTWKSIIFHSAIMCFGVVNFILQFFPF